MLLLVAGTEHWDSASSSLNQTLTARNTFAGGSFIAFSFCSREGEEEVASTCSIYWRIYRAIQKASIERVYIAFRKEKWWENVPFKSSRWAGHLLHLLHTLNSWPLVLDGFFPMVSLISWPCFCLGLFPNCASIDILFFLSVSRPVDGRLPGSALTLVPLNKSRTIRSSPTLLIQEVGSSGGGVRTDKREREAPPPH